MNKKINGTIYNSKQFELHIVKYIFILMKCVEDKHTHRWSFLKIIEKLEAIQENLNSKDKK